MVMSDFLGWIEDASAGARAEGANALAKAYLYGDFTPGDRFEAELALTALLDDPSALVRHALAEAFAGALDAPRPLVTALISDHSDVAAPLLARSPMLRDHELIDCAATGDTHAQVAIASRAHLSAPVSAALAEIGQAEAVIALCSNEGAQIMEFSQRRIIERYCDDGAVREALLARHGLGASVRMDLVEATAKTLSGFVQKCAWLGTGRLERVMRECRENAALAIAASLPPDTARTQTIDLVRTLQESRNLTTAFLLRALLCANVRLVEAALAVASGLSVKRVCGLMLEPKSNAFRALCKKAHVPDSFVPVFKSALLGLREERLIDEGLDHKIITGDCLLRPLINRVIKDCMALAQNATARQDKVGANASGGSIIGADMARLIVMLQRMEAQAIRDDAKLFKNQMLVEKSAQESAQLEEAMAASAMVQEQEAKRFKDALLLDDSFIYTQEAPLDEEAWIDPGSAWRNPDDAGYHYRSGADTPEDWQDAA